MNPATVTQARKLFQAIVERMPLHLQRVLTVIAPPFPFLADLRSLNTKDTLSLAAQGVYFEALGAHTGEVSATMVKSVSAKYVIIGHSEQRAKGLSDEEVAKDIQAALAQGLTAIVCVGELMRDAGGNYFGVVEGQLRAAVAGLTAKDTARVVIAYEPVWAIGTGNTATAAEVHEMKLFIQKVLADVLGRERATAMRIVYGGSTNKKNAKELLEVGLVDGFLIGGASLRAAEFVTIVRIAETYAKGIAKTR